MSKIKITLTGPGRGELLINDKVVECTEFKLFAGVGRENKLVVFLRADEVEVIGETMVETVKVVMP